MAVDDWEPSFMRLSPSKINTYMKCPREFYYKYIAKIPTCSSPNSRRSNSGKMAVRSNGWKVNL